MRVLIVGAAGFIGSAVAARLVAQGHSVVAAARAGHTFGLLAGKVEVVPLDLARANAPEVWLPHLVGVDAVVNCAGILQEGWGESAQRIHVDAVAALARACEQARVRRFVQVSAAGVERGAASAFSRTKRLGEEVLMGADLDWVILRPSLVVGRQAYGGSALLRGLAALPIVPLVPRTGPLQAIHLDDVVDAIIAFLRPGAPARVAVDLVGPQPRSFDELVRLLRTWMRWPAAREVPLPGGRRAPLPAWRPRRMARLAAAHADDRAARDRARRDRRSRTARRAHRNPPQGPGRCPRR